MKAVFFDKHGGPDVLRYGDFEDPVPGAGEVLVDVKASSLNHLDLFVRRGLPGIRLPHITGSDAAGIVAAAGDGVTDVRPGERVLIHPTSSPVHRPKKNSSSAGNSAPTY